MLGVTLRFGRFAEIGFSVKTRFEQTFRTHHRKAGHKRPESHVHCSYGNSSDPLHVRGS
jgi:hypothetical protein